jgi:prolipoprotein diacylglyceryltransferase
MRIGLWWFEPYTLKVFAGVLVALLWLWWNAPRYVIERQRLFKWLWLFAVVAVLSGRWGYVVGNDVYFAQNLTAIFRLDQVGGLHGGSAMAGGLFVAWIWTRATTLRLRTMLDFLSPAVLCIAASAWWGCVNVGCAWGQEVLAASGWQHWFVAELPDIYRTVAARYAVQPIGAVLALMLAVLAGVRREWGGIALGLYLLGSAGLTFVRADVVPQLGSLRSDLVLDMVLAGLVFATIVWDSRRMSISELLRS